MAYVEFNNNPCGRRVGDCAVRAISKALDMGWEAAYIALTINGLQMGDMPSSDVVSGSLLRQYNFRRKAVPDTCPLCYTAQDFCEDHTDAHGVYVLYFGGHVACVRDGGNLYDAWDSSKEVVQYYWYKEEGDE